MPFTVLSFMHIASDDNSVVISALAAMNLGLENCCLKSLDHLNILYLLSFSLALDSIAEADKFDDIRPKGMTVSRSLNRSSQISGST